MSLFRSYYYKFYTGIQKRKEKKRVEKKAPETIIFDFVQFH